MAKSRHAETKAMRAAYEGASDRDGYCRLYVLDAAERVRVWSMFGNCFGRSEFAHIGDTRRFKTRGMAPERRHCREGGIMLCAGHHRVGACAYDLNRMSIEELTDRRADGPLRFWSGDSVYEETE